MTGDSGSNIERIENLIRQAEAQTAHIQRQIAFNEGVFKAELAMTTAMAKVIHQDQVEKILDQYSKLKPNNQ